MHRIVFILIFISKSGFCQLSVKLNVSPKDTIFEINDYWLADLSPLTDLNDIVSYIHRDPFRSDFIHKIPAGNPLVREISVNSFYGNRIHPIHKVSKFHKGIDLQGTFGEKVLASGDGKVISCGYDVNLGNFIKIHHNYGFESIYGHLSKINVKKGQILKNNEIIGLIGATGNVTGPHLHYTLKKNGSYIDPFDFIFMSFRKDY